MTTHHKLDINFSKNQTVKFQWSLEQCQPPAVIQSVSTVLAKPECTGRGQVATGSCSVFTAALDPSVNVQGSRLLCHHKPSVTVLIHPYLRAPAAQEEAYTSSDPPQDTSYQHSVLGSRDKHNTLPHGLPRVAPKTKLNSRLCSRLLLLLQLCRIKRVYSFALVGSTPGRFQENVPRPPIRAIMLLLEPKEGWHSVFIAHAALNSPVPWPEERQSWSQSPDCRLHFFQMFKSLQPFCSIQCVLTKNCSRVQAKTVGKTLSLSLWSENKNKKIQAALNIINV